MKILSTGAVGIIAMIGIVVAIVAVGLISFIPKQSDPQVTQKDSLVQGLPRFTSTPQLSPSPNNRLPFDELTIPFLRRQQYQSQLGSMQMHTENADFTAFVTSYTSNGLRINGYLTRPKGEMPSGGWPAIVFVHGYIPPAQYQTTQNYVSYVNFLARNGFVVFKIDLRGHGNSEGEASGAYYSGDYIVDTLNAHAALQSSDFVNDNQIGLWGHSMAGNVVLRSIAAKPDIPAAVIWAGAGFTYTDLQEFRIADSSYRSPPPDSERAKKRQQLRDLHGDFNVESEFWKQVVPTNYLSDYKGAIQLHHAVNDAVVNVGYSRNLDAILNQTSIPHQLHVYSDGGHNLTGANFTQAMQRSVEFFKNYLQ